MMPIIRKQLKPSDVYPDDIRYNDTTGQVQSLVNGEWVDNPAVDPRKITSFPPRITSDTRCDAAQSVTDAFHATINQTIQAVQDGATAISIAGTILGLFSFGPFGIFIALALLLARAMVEAGASTLEAAMTTEAYHDLACALYCVMDANGRITETDLSTAETMLGVSPGGTAAAVFVAMLQLAGFGGVNNLAALGTSTGSCGDCGCGWCYEFNFLSSDGGFTVVPGYSGIYSGGWYSAAYGSGQVLYAQLAIPLASGINHIEADVSGGDNYNAAVFIDGTSTAEAVNITGPHTITWNGTLSGGYVKINTSSGAAQNAVTSVMTRLKLSGSGENPFGSDNCT